MYVIGQGHEHLGPGTSLVQRINWTQAQENEMRGFGAIKLFPEFANDCNAMSSSCAEKGIGSLRGCGCGGKCGKECGLGLFESGIDASGWGIGEWAIVVIGGYMVVSTVFTTKRAASRIAAIPGEHRKRRAAKYRAKAAELTRKKK